MLMYKAIKSFRCSKCGGIIKKGMKYYFKSNTNRFHLGCADDILSNIENTIYECLIYGPLFFDQINNSHSHKTRMYKTIKLVHPDICLALFHGDIGIFYLEGDRKKAQEMLMEKLQEFDWIKLLEFQEKEWR
jgi:hypothetical protein